VARAHDEGWRTVSCDRAAVPIRTSTSTLSTVEWPARFVSVDRSHTACPQARTSSARRMLGRAIRSGTACMSRHLDEGGRHHLVPYRRCRTMRATASSAERSSESWWPAAYGYEGSVVVDVEVDVEVVVVDLEMTNGSFDG